MRKFLASFWFPFLICLILGGVTAAAFALLKPTGADMNNEELKTILRIVGWAIGPATALLSLIGIAILNGIRRIVRLRRTSLLHPVVVLIGVVPWLVIAWMLTDEPLYTDFARGLIEFVARPMLWGSLVATLLTLLFSIPLAFPKKKK